jgi:hypothetical protein
MEAVEWRLLCWIHRRRVDRTLKKYDLQTLINPATDPKEEAESEMKEKTSMEE